jgi:hypothetical protein
MPETARPINILVLLDSMRRHINEMERRGDPVEIRNAEGALWDVALEHEVRRHKVPQIPLPRVRRIEP